MLKQLPPELLPQIFETVSDQRLVDMLGRVELDDMLELIEGQLLVTINATEFFGDRIENEEQLETALTTIKRRVEKLLGQGKKVLVQ